MNIYKKDTQFKIIHTALSFLNDKKWNSDIHVVADGRMYATDYASLVICDSYIIEPGHYKVKKASSIIVVEPVDDPAEPHWFWNAQRMEETIFPEQMECNETAKWVFDFARVIDGYFDPARLLKIPTPALLHYTPGKCRMIKAVSDRLRIFLMGMNI